MWVVVVVVTPLSLKGLSRLEEEEEEEEKVCPLGRLGLQSSLRVHFHVKVKARVKEGRLAVGIVMSSLSIFIRGVGIN